ATIALPYSKTFFREPLAAFCLLLSAYGLERWRQTLSNGSRRRWSWLALSVLAFGAAQFTKDASILAVPALLAVALPAFAGLGVRWTRARIRQLLWILGAGALALAALAVPAGYEMVRRLAGANLEWVPEAVGGYLISPGKSIFVYSPALLLGLAGVVALARMHRWRYVLAPLLLLAGFVLGYAILQNARWFGGQGWGARYMTPVTGMLLLPALPIFEPVLEGQASRVTRAAVVALVALSVAVQIIGVAIPVTRYGQLVPEGVAWTTGVWEPAQTHIAANLQLMSNPDEWRGIAWWHILGRDFTVPALCALLMGCFAAGMIVCSRARGALTLRRLLALAAAAGVAVTAVFGYALSRYTANDTDYLGGYQPLHDMLNYLGEHVAPGEIVALDNPRYRLFFYTFNKRQRLHVVVMPNSPGEQPSPDQPPEIVSDNPDHLIRSWIPRAIHTLAGEHPAMWLVMDSSPFIPWSVRPVEQWMARHYFPVDEHRVTDQVRAVYYSTAHAPQPFIPPWPAELSGAVFGDMLELVGYDQTQDGKMVNLSLVWRTLSKPSIDYNVGLFLLDAAGVPVAERHSAPVGGFGHTSQWEPGQAWRDNHALRLPAPGEYTLRLILYNWQDGARLPVTGPDGADWGDAIDLDTIQVSDRP
ncbi:MAG: hypothetical protein JXB47_20200, partial [Anaerolineae bacterium]|nr:hypothetical protein [Anaerolineae bacterium]